MVGAPLLTGKAALRTGAGLVTIAAPAATASKLEKRVEEIMTLALPDSLDGSSKAVAAILEFADKRKVSVVVVGPGLAVTGKNVAIVSSLLNKCRLPILIDGGGLGALQDQLGQLENATSKAVILTPHVGEFQRLLHEPLPEDRRQLKPIAAQFAQKYRLTLVLKGHPTYIAHADGAVLENTTGNPGLATAGTGDVLSGIIAGIIAQGIGPEEAAEAGVYLHGLAGDIAATKKTQPGMIAGDVIEAIPTALRRVGGPL